MEAEKLSRPTLLPDPNDLERPAVDPAHWALDPHVHFLNHGSFGACPLAVLEAQREWRDRLERQPVRFFIRELEAHLDAARAALARFLGAQPDDLAFVPNATHGVNTVLRSLIWRPGDELLVTDHEYNACRNALNFVAERHRARAVVARIPFPIRRAEDAVDAVLARITPRTRLALIDHVTSPTGLILPIDQLSRELSRRGVDLLVDGAHAPGMVPLRLASLGAAYYTGNCHKWLCAPKGSGFLWVRRDRQRLIRPLAISHGANSPRTDRSRFQVEFGWTGTADPTPWLAMPEALRWMAARLHGGWPAVRRRNRCLALAARELLCRQLDLETPCPAAMVGSLASIRLPNSRAGKGSRTAFELDPLQTRLLREARIEVPIIPWPGPPRRLLRISAQLYNHLGEYRRLGHMVRRLLG